MKHEVGRPSNVGLRGALPNLRGLAKRLLSAAAVAIGITVGLASCDNSSQSSPGRARLPNPVESKDGLAYIPIDDTAFLIPEKKWLKGYSRKSTDGLVYSITLHATIPDVQPWSPERNDEMYWPAGPGKKLEIYIFGDRGDQARNFPDVPNSIFHSAKFIEEPSDQTAQGLHRFRQLWTFYKDQDAENEAVENFGKDAVDRLRKKAGKPMMATVFYEFIEHDHVKYFIYCSDGKGGIFKSCHLLFPWTRTLMVDVHFVRDHISHIVSIADRLSDRLREFEAAGLARRASLLPQSNSPH